ncbi:IclR family transcriptional regulator [Thermaerobacter litoralis]
MTGRNGPPDDGHPGTAGRGKVAGGDLENAGQNPGGAGGLAPGHRAGRAGTGPARSGSARQGKGGAREGYVIHAVVKALDVLFAFREPPHEHSLADVARITGLGKNQCFRCLKTLEAYGLVRLGDHGRYVLTPMLLSLAVLAAEERSLIRVAQPILDRLAAETGETVHLIALVDGMAVVIDRRDGPAGLRLATPLGARSPLHAGAVPKAMLAFMPEAEQNRVLDMLPFLPRYTERTVVDPQQLRAELAEIRRRGYAISDEDIETGARGVGAPIFDARGRVVAGVSAGGPSLRIPRERLEHLGELVRLAARDISRQLGYAGAVGAAAGSG